MRWLIFGGRDFSPATEHITYLNDLRAYFQALRREVTTVVVGRARGADQFGEQWATLCGIPVDAFPADWNTYGKAAGFIRNQRMLDSGIDIGVQFPGGKGTADMRRRLDKAGVRTFEYPK